MTAYSYQLYGSRNNPPLDRTLAMLAAAGYRETEGYGGVYADPQATRAAHDAAGLTMPSAHFSLDLLTNDSKIAIETAQALGVSSIYAPHLAEAERPTDGPGYRAFADQLETLARTYGAAGFHFGWHNHAFEFAALDDGTVPMKVILDHAPSIGWEADIAWIVRGKADPFQWLAAYQDRVSAIHIKDIAPVGECLDEDGWADVGYGTMEWPALMNAVAGAPVKHFVMEHDKPNDDARFARRSIDYLKTI
ncbi:MAG: sugar phosphate isomerase/epimerase [Rhodospirillales bacterium]|nr:sugar phosphate isomerase/epimerase [Rhodospirillales bacterium]